MPFASTCHAQGKARERQKWLGPPSRIQSENCKPGGSESGWPRPIPGDEFDNHQKVHCRDVVERAWELARAPNRGAAGIDKQTIADVEECGVSKLLDQLAADSAGGEAGGRCPRAGGSEPKAWM